MSFSVKVIVYAADDQRVLQLVRKAVEWDGAKVQEFTSRTADSGAKEVYVELQLTDADALDSILRRVESVKGAAIMAATEPKEVPPSIGITE